jgi:hypothetical protein
MTTNWLAYGEVAAGIELFSAWVEAGRAYRGLPGLTVAGQEVVWAQGGENFKDRIEVW